MMGDENCSYDSKRIQTFQEQNPVNIKSTGKCTHWNIRKANLLSDFYLVNAKIYLKMLKLFEP